MNAKTWELRENEGVLIYNGSEMIGSVVNKLDVRGVDFRFFGVSGLNSHFAHYSKDMFPVREEIWIELLEGEKVRYRFDSDVFNLQEIRKCRLGIRTGDSFLVKGDDFTSRISYLSYKKKGSDIKARFDLEGFKGLTNRNLRKSQGVVNLQGFLHFGFSKKTKPRIERGHWFDFYAPKEYTIVKK